MLCCGIGNISDGLTSGANKIKKKEQCDWIHTALFMSRRMRSQVLRSEETCRKTHAHCKEMRPISANCDNEKHYAKDVTGNRTNFLNINHDRKN